MSIHYDNLCVWCKGQRFKWAAAWVGVTEEDRAKHMPPAPEPCPKCWDGEHARQFQKAAAEGTP